MKPDKICDDNFSIGKYFNNVVNIVKRKVNSILFNENQFIVSDFPSKSNTAKIELNPTYLETLIGANKNLQQITDVGNTTTNNINVKNVKIGDVVTLGGEIVAGIDISDSEHKKLLLDANNIYKLIGDGTGSYSVFRVDSQNNIVLEKYESLTQEQLVSVILPNKKLSLKTVVNDAKFIWLLDPVANNITHTTEKTIPISVNGQFANAEGEITLSQNLSLQEVTNYGNTTQNNIHVKKVFIGTILNDKDGIRIYNYDDSNSVTEIRADEMSMTQNQGNFLSRLRITSQVIVFDFNNNGNDLRVDFSGNAFYIELNELLGSFNMTVRLPRPTTNINEQKIIPISVNNNFSDQFGNINLPEIKYYTGTITQSNSNLPVITSNVTDANNINLTFNITQIITGYVSVEIFSNEININDYIAKMFIEDNIVNAESIENLKTDIIKYETTYNVVNIYTFRNNVSQNDILNNRFTIHLYKK